MKRINYRGPLTGCNFHCSYCPLKRVGGGFSFDQKCLVRFTDFIKNSAAETYSVLFTPYGEAMQYGYYTDALGALSKLANVAAVSVQTNFSFDADTFLKRLTTTGADFSKIKLWCTFHPEYFTAAEFAEKAGRLYESIELSVGAVGTEAGILEIQELRRALNPEIYLWINAHEGRKTEYHAKTIAAFCAIDPFFPLQLAKRRCNRNCAGVLVDGRGEAVRCVRHKERLGNLYRGGLKEPEKTAKCDCFLSYNNRLDIPENRYLSHLRLIERTKAQAVFFDIDGTLTGTDEPQEDILNALVYLSARYRLFAATSLPYASAKRTLGKLHRYFSDGVFADGAYLSAGGQKTVIPLDDTLLTGGTEYMENGTLYKRVFKNTPENIKRIKSGIGEHARCAIQGGTVGIVAKTATKQNGVAAIAKHLKLSKDRIVTVGDSENDRGMLSAYNGFSVGNKLNGFLKIRIANLPFLLTP